MAQTTTAINSCNTSIWLDSDAGTLTDISGSANILDVNFDKEIGSYVTFQEKWPRRLECGKDATFTLTVVYSTTADEGKDILFDWYFGAGGEKSFAWYSPDKDVGSDYFHCEVVQENMRWAYSRTEPGTIAITTVLRPSGTVSHSVAGT